MVSTLVGSRNPLVVNGKELEVGDTVDLLGDTITN